MDIHAAPLSLVRHTHIHTRNIWIVSWSSTVRSSTHSIHARLSLFIASYYLTPHGLLHLSFRVVIIIIIIIVHCDFFLFVLQQKQCLVLKIKLLENLVRGEC
jgi:hypothetical protein